MSSSKAHGSDSPGKVPSGPAEADPAPSRRGLLDVRGYTKVPISQHYRQPGQRPFTAGEFETTTILIGGLTRKHERFIQAVFQGSGYRCEILPTPDQTAFQLGKEYGNNGQCSPAYFTAGSLIKFLKDLEAGGMPRPEIIDRYVFFTAGSCGPCRFGMYAAEYRLALQNAGFDGFRVIRFQQDHGVKQKSEEPGLKYTVDFGLGMLKALYLGDVLNDITLNLRPYEITPGETDRVMERVVDDLCEHLNTFKTADPLQLLPSWLARWLSRHGILKNTVIVSYRFRKHLRGEPFREVLNRSRGKIDSIRLDRTRVKPIVKIIGEFWAQTTEGDGNYRMFDFLEREGAQVQGEAIGTWLTYLLTHARLQLYPRRGLDQQGEEPEAWSLRRKLSNEISFHKKKLSLAFGEWIYTRLYHQVIDALGGVAHRLVCQDKLVRLADPFYKHLARGGEGYLEVGKNIYYNLNHLCHMVLSLKPFGCMPSSQSDGIQSAVVNRFRDMIYLPIETSGEGEVNAHSRVQMALGEAKAKAKLEFQEALAGTGRALEDIRAFMEKHPDLHRPFYRIPRYNGYAGVAANFVVHVHEMMAGRLPAPVRSAANFQPVAVAKEMQR